MALPGGVPSELGEAALVEGVSTREVEAEVSRLLLPGLSLQGQEGAMGEA